MDGDGAAGPDVNPAAVEAAIEESSKPQIDVQSLLQALDANK
jgi:hypothetical protein